LKPLERVVSVFDISLLFNTAIENVDYSKWDLVSLTGDCKKANIPMKKTKLIIASFLLDGTWDNQVNYSHLKKNLSQKKALNGGKINKHASIITTS
jgi:hypothetical protein